MTQRAVQLQAGGRPALDVASDVERRDLLADVVEVMGGKERVRSEWARRQVGERWPETYGGWSAQRFAAELAAVGVAIRSGRLDGQAGQRYLALDEVLDAVDARAEQDEAE